MLTHVLVRNYKSLAKVDVDLGPLTILVGPNGTGKSNFVDALRFLSDALTTNLEQAIVDRGGMDSIRWNSHLTPSSTLSFDLKFKFKEEVHRINGRYNLALSGGGSEYKVDSETSIVGPHTIQAEEGRFGFKGQPIDPAHIGTSTLGLSLLRDEYPFASVWISLARAKFYSIYPTRSLREPSKLTPSYYLQEDGSNLSSVLWRMQRDIRPRFDALKMTLSRIIPELTAIRVELLGSYLVVKLVYKHGDTETILDLSQESDGTIRLLAILTALYQDPSPPLIALEEPELNVHPGALFTLYEVIKETSLRSQILITTHSPDLISLADPNDLRVVEKVNGSTKISPLDERQIGIINDKLFSTSDLLRIEGLRGRQSD